MVLRLLWWLGNGSLEWKEADRGEINRSAPGGGRGNERGSGEGPGGSQLLVRRNSKPDDIGSSSSCPNLRLYLPLFHLLVVIMSSPSSLSSAVDESPRSTTSYSTTTSSNLGVVKSNGVEYLVIDLTANVRRTQHSWIWEHGRQLYLFASSPTANSKRYWQCNIYSTIKGV